MTTARDDRVLPETRALGVFIVPFLLVAFPLLYFFPNDTGNWWAWEIRPSMTALIMGAGYIAGAYFFVRVARATRWHGVHLGFLPITAFTAFLGVATFIHWDQFDHDHVAFWIWTGLYVTTPFLVPLAWLRNRRTDPGTLESADDRYLPQGVRSTLKAAGVTQVAIAVVLITSPSTMVDIWPWMLNSLGAATLGAWFALPGVTALMMGIDGRWSAIRITLESQLIGLSLILLATVRSWAQFDKDNALTYVFAGGIALLLIGLAGLWSSNVLRRPNAPVGSGDPGRGVGLAQLEQEARMALARVVSFDGVTKDRMEEMRGQMADGEQPEGLPAKEIIVLHDPEGEKSLVILFFDTEDDYRAGDEVLNAMPTGDTPGQRASVTRYDVAARMAV